VTDEAVGEEAPGTANPAVALTLCCAHNVSETTVLHWTSQYHRRELLQKLYKQSSQYKERLLEIVRRVLILS
jgi:CelD/BcsL family acetyltransferase involved in cellulose biosynthesis